MNELLEASDRTFVEVAYRAVLRREPDPQGFDQCLRQLRSGALSKVEILGSLRWSPEGRARAVHVDGLMVPYALHRWQRKPIIGPIIAWFHGALRLGSVSQRQQRAEAMAACEAHALGASITSLARAMEERLAQLEILLSQQLNLIDQHRAEYAIALDERDQRLAQIESSANDRDHRIARLGSSLDEGTQRLMQLASSASDRDDRIARLGSSLNEGTQRLASLESSANERDDRIAKLGLSLDEGIQRLARVESSANERDDRIAKLGSALEKRAHQLSEVTALLDKRIGELQASNLETYQAVHAIERSIAAAKEKLQKDRVEVERGLTRIESSVESLSATHHAFVDRIASMQSHLDTLMPFPAALVSAQQALDELRQKQIDTAAAFNDVARLELRVHEVREQFRMELDQTRGVLEVEARERAQQGLRLSKHDEELAAHRSSLRGQDAILSHMELARAQKQKEERSLDPLYAAFEDRFRGDPELVRARAEPYIQLVVEAGAGSAATPVLDLGCGRGEWLDVLREHDLVGQGIDSNQVFVDICRGRGLAVTEGDVLDVMRSLPDGGFGAVTGMHIAEHLPFEALVMLLDEAKRLLAPGGLLALETPNPENLQVSTQWFYMDPTHRNPLPPEALRWIVEARGFDQARIERWSVARETFAPPLLEADIPGAESMNVLLAQLAVAPDYAIIARRGMP